MVENMGSNEVPVLITQSEFMRRYREMSALNGGMNFYGELPESYTISVNYEHPLIKKIVDSIESEVSPALKDIYSKLEKAKEDQEKSDLEKERDQKVGSFASGNELLKQICDLALLSNNMLKGEELNRFIRRSIDIIK